MVQKPKSSATTTGNGGGGADDDQLPDEVTRQRLDKALRRSLAMPSKASKNGQESNRGSRPGKGKKQSRSKD